MSTPVSDCSWRWRRFGAPALTLAITPHSRDAERAVGALFHSDLAQGTYLENVTPAFAADTLALCQLFRLHPVALHYAGEDRRLQFEAMTLPGPSDRRIFITNHARSPERALIGHELGHQLRQERPDLYEELARCFADAGVDRKQWGFYYRAMAAQTQRQEGIALSADRIREEAVCDAVGDLLLDPVVWHALKRPTLLERLHAWVVQVWREWLNQAPPPASPLGGARLLVDHELAKSALTRILRTWSEAIGRPLSANDADETAAPMNDPRHRP